LLHSTLTLISLFLSLFLTLPFARVHSYGGVRAAYARTVADPGVGAKFSLANPKSDVEWKVLAAKGKPGPGEHGDVGPTAVDRARLNRAGSSLAGTWAVPDHHPFAAPPRPQPIPLLRNWRGEPPAPLPRLGTLPAAPHGSGGDAYDDDGHGGEGSLQGSSRPPGSAVGFSSASVSSYATSGNYR